MKGSYKRFFQSYCSMLVKERNLSDLHNVDGGDCVCVRACMSISMYVFMYVCMHVRT